MATSSSPTGPYEDSGGRAHTTSRIARSRSILTRSAIETGASTSFMPATFSTASTRSARRCAPDGARRLPARECHPTRRRAARCCAREPIGNASSPIVRCTAVVTIGTRSRARRWCSTRGATCFYSGGRWENESYGVDYAVASHVLGPYTDYGDGSGARVLRTRGQELIGPGHNSIVRGPNDETDYLVYHAWDRGMTARRLCIDPVDWTREGPRCQGPTTTAQALRRGVSDEKVARRPRRRRPRARGPPRRRPDVPA